MAEAVDVNNLKPTQEGGGLSANEAANLLNQLSQPQPEPEAELSDVVETDEEILAEDNSDDQQLETEDDYEEEAVEETEESFEEDDDGEAGFDFNGEFVSEKQLLEWRESGLRQEDYTRKTQEVAELKTQFTQQLEQQVEVLAKQSEALEQYGHLIAAQMELSPHTDEQLSLIREQEGIEAYIDAKEQLEQRRGYLQQVFQELQQTKQAQQEQEALLKQQAQAEAFQAISEKIPEYADPEKGQPLRDGVAKLLKDDFGFTQEDLDGLDDPRYFLVAHELWSMKQGQSPDLKKSIAKKKAKRSVSPVNKGGSPTSKRQRVSKANQQQMQSALQDGSVEAATAALNAITGDR